MSLNGYKHREIGESLGVSSGFISKWTRHYEQSGVSGLRLGYKGSVGYLSATQRQDVITWLKNKDYWSLTELQQHMEQEYEVVFESKQSYYTLFKEAGISWKKTQNIIPRPMLSWSKKKRH
jgi:putative transposase